MQEIFLAGSATRTRNILYWVSTGILAFCLIPGVLRNCFTLHRTSRELYVWATRYISTILGFWKILGGIAILVPRLPLIKEWAYAGIAFDLSGAAVSNVASGMPVWHVVAPLILLLITILSWAWRPASRTILIS